MNTKQPSPKNNRNQNLRLVVLLIAMIILFIAVFRLLKTYELFIVAVILYTVIGLAAALYYIIYNRGVISGRITPEMLPKEWSPEQKQAMVDDIAARRRRSKWAILVFVPVIATVCFELLESYFFPLMLSFFTKK